MPSSRATIAECDNRLPRSTTMADALVNSAIQPGSVWRATRISPRSSASLRDRVRPGRAHAQCRRSSRFPRARRRRPVGRDCGVLRARAADRGRPSRSRAQAGRAARPRAAISVLAQRGKTLEVGARAEAFDGAEHLRHREEEDVARRIERAGRRRIGCPWRGRCAVHGRKRACARSAGSRGRARALWQAAEHGAREALERLAGKKINKRIALAPSCETRRRVPPARAAAMAMSRGPDPR